MNQCEDCDPQAADSELAQPAPDIGSEPLISIIIPVYQVEPLLHRCVDSVLAQTYRRIEVILVDDGSTDRSGAICDAYASADPRVIVVHQDNLGLSAARNTGLDASRGSWITFIDSDDWVHVEMLERLLNLARHDEADLVICGFHRIHDGESPQIPAKTDDSVVLTPVEAMRAFIGRLDTNMVVSWGKLYRHELLEGVRFPLGRFHEDAFTTHRAVWNARRISHTETPLYFYYQRQGSITSTRSTKKRTDVRDAILERANFYDAIGLSYEASRMVQANFWRTMRVLRSTSTEGDARRTAEIRSEVRVVQRQTGGLPMPIRFRLALLSTYVSPRAMQLYLRWLSVQQSQ